MSQWSDQMDRLLTISNRIFGHVTSYQRPGFPAFSITGVPEFLDRLENVNQGQFYSLFYKSSDFDTAPFTSSVVATFSSTPNTNGTITFDGITYQDVLALDNSTPYQFLRSTSALNAAENLVSAINADPSFSGIFFSSATTKHPTCSAAWSLNDDGSVSVTVSYVTPGIVGDTILASEAMSGVTLSGKQFQGGAPLENDLITLNGILYRVSDVPEPDPEGGIQLRLEKKAL